MSIALAEIVSRNVNFDNIEKFIGQKVCVHGKVESTSNGTAFLIVQEDPSKKITVNNFNKAIPKETFVKVIGEANGDKSINYIDSFQLSGDFDLNLINEIIKLEEQKDLAVFFE